MNASCPTYCVSRLSHTATNCNTLQRTASYEDAVSYVFGVSTPSLESKIRATLQIHMLQGALQCVAVCCSVLQCVAVCCSVLQCVAVCVSTPSLESKLARTSRDLCNLNISQRSAAVVFRRV